MKKSQKGGFTLIELLVVIAIIGILSAVVLASLSTARTKARDASRVSELRQIQYALNLYFSTNGNYPACLYTGACTTPLEGSIFMKSVPKDPLSGLGFSYAGIGSGTTCSAYHLGVSLENKNHPALQSGADAPVAGICTGSLADFDGLSYATAGQLCNTTPGTPQPTTNPNGETCYDVKS